MNSFLVFCKKEWIELHRTKKLYIFLGIFVLFGMLSPLLSRYMQEIFTASMGDSFPVVVSPTTWVDSYSQLYSNLSQMGGISIIFIFMGCVVGEKQSGSAALTLTKNLPYTTFIMAKFIAAAALVIISTFSAVLLCYTYTYYLFGYAGEFQNVFMGALVYSIFAVVLLGATVLSSTIAKSTAVSALLSFCAFLLLIGSNYVPKIGVYLPGTLLSKTLEITTITFTASAIWSSVVALCMIYLCLFASIRILKGQEI